jgi:hypothetical protein
MSYYLAPSLVKLRDEVNARWPNRDKASDGWIGDPSHSSRASDHNPDWNAGGVVRALDVDKDGIDVDAVLAEVIGDPRVWYVIWDSHIYSRTYNWTKRAYSGSNPHDKHFHVSLVHSRDSENDTSEWLAKPTYTRGPEVDRSLTLLRRALRKVIHPERQRGRAIKAALDSLRSIPRKEK